MRTRGSMLNVLATTPGARPPTKVKTLVYCKDVSPLCYMAVVFVDNVRRCSDGPRPLGGGLTKYQAQCEAAARAVEFTMGKGALGHAESFKLISPEQHLAAFFNGTNKPGPKIKEHADRFINSS